MRGASIVLSLLCFTAFSLHAQCSDAGVCVIGSGSSPSGHRIGVGYQFGMSGAPDDLVFHTVQLDAGVRIHPGSDLTLLLPWVRVTGPLGSVSGLGDLTVLWNRRLWEGENEQLRIQFGAKLPIKSAAPGSLPQAYQPSLGTTDAIFGISYETAPWLFALGYQLSGGRSDNALTRLERGDDCFARVAHRRRLGEADVGFELLAIQRLGRSSVLGPTTGGMETFIDVPESVQLQLNLLGTISLPVGEGWSLKGSVAAPVRKRRANVDGLTRSFTMAVGFSFAP